MARNKRPKVKARSAPPTVGLREPLEVRDTRGSELRRKGGLKGSTVGTTVYLLPDESWRVKQLAVDLKITVHELILRGLDQMLQAHNKRPIRRYASERTKRARAD
jgi:hypothetical protein